MKIGRYYRQPQGGALPTQWGDYDTPYVTVDKSEYRYQKPGPPLMLRGRHEHRQQPRPVGVRSMVEQHPASAVPTGFDITGGSLGSFGGDPNMGTLSGSLFSDSPSVGLDYADQTSAHYEQGNPEQSVALGMYPGPAMLAAKVKSFFKHPVVLALLALGGIYIAYKLFVQPRLLTNPAPPTRRRYRRGGKTGPRKKGSRKPPPRNKSLSIYAKKRERNTDGTFKKTK